MNLYLLEQDYNNSYDTYDALVVAAESEEDAKKIQPSHYIGSWAPIEYITCTQIGIANPDMPRGVVCSSFNAG